MEKTQINTQLLLASLNKETGNILYTWVLTYPRFILSEVNTHRMFSRNTSSSRAIPVKTLRSRVLHDPFIPEYWGSNQKGMQAGDELNFLKKCLCKAMWGLLRYPAVAASWGFEKIGLHKQIANRILEPWMWTRQIVSATELENFFSQRCQENTEPHFSDLAWVMWEQRNIARGRLRWMKRHEIRREFEYSAITGGTHYQVLEPGQWHLPFMREEDDGLFLETRKQLSAARCARVSYNASGTNRAATLKEDLAVYEKLASSNPRHLSPMEHQAQALYTPERVGNFVGWKQFRKELE